MKTERQPCEAIIIPVSSVQMKRKKGEEAEEAEEEERALSVIANLFQGLARGSRRDRLAAKFVENEFEKCDRLMELYSRYHQRVRAAEVSSSPEADALSPDTRAWATTCHASRCWCGSDCWGSPFDLVCPSCLVRPHSAVQADMEAAAEDELTADERLLARMDQGLYSLQQCALIVGHLWFVGDLGVRKRLLQLLHQKVRSSTSTQHP